MNILLNIVIIYLITYQIRKELIKKNMISLIICMAFICEQSTIIYSQKKKLEEISQFIDNFLMLM